MSDINFKHFQESLKTDARQGMDGELQLKTMLTNMDAKQMVLIKLINDGPVMFVIRILGLSYDKAIKAIRMYADGLEKSVKICKEKL